MKKLAIFGTGGAGREVAEWARACGFEDIVLTVDDNFFTSVEINRFLCIPFSQIAIEEYRWLVAIADSSLREVIAKKINNQAEFATLVHPAATVEQGVQIGEGTLIGPGVLIGNNVKIGKHVFVNTQSYIGHDCVIADYVTISPCTAVLGNCKVESHVFLGANSSIKEGTSISSGTIVGMGAVVIKNLSRGVYVGNPARKIN
jgi:sugar O-acyltransferase (sialic acid O-acetyltransferase NeuD family)